jgi:DNA-binding NarL/FixJ family response regulator
METILIADDHEIVRRGIRMIIQTFPTKYNFIEVGTASAIITALNGQRIHHAVLDVSLADGNILSVIESISAYSHQTNFLIYSMSAARTYAWRLLKSGAKGFLEKQSSMEELEKAIRELLNGGVYLSPELEKELFDPALNSERDNLLNSLTNRELEVVEYLATGLGSKEIANKMKLDITTVSTFRRRAFEKLGVANVIEMKKKLSL